MSAIDMSPDDVRYFSGQGQVFLGPVGGYVAADAVGFVWVGNVASLEIGLAKDQTQHQEAFTGGRTKDRTLVTGRTLTGTLAMESYIPANWSRWLESSEVAEVAGTGVSFSFGDPTLNQMIPLGKEGITSLVITDSASGGPNTLVAGTNYILDADHGSVRFIDKTTGGLVAPFTGTFNHEARTIVPVYTVTTGVRHLLRYHALNTAETSGGANLPSIVELFSIEFEGTTIPLINEAFGAVNVPFTAYQDTTRSATGTLGQFGQVRTTVLS